MKFPSGESIAGGFAGIGQLALSLAGIPATALVEKACEHWLWGKEGGFLEVLLLTAPLSIGVGLIVLIWPIVAEQGKATGVVVSGGILGFTTWLGQRLSIGHAADPHGGRWQNFTGILTDTMASNTVLKAFGYLLAYFQLYGLRLFILASLAGVFLAWKVKHGFHELLKVFEE